MISPYSIQKILDTARVEDVLGDFISIKKRGINYIANCPFHNEKTPSFVISPVKGIYKCFGCSAAGNSVKFLMEHEKLSYPDALRYLAKKYNIEIEEIETTKEVKELIDLRESLLIALEYAKNVFVKNLIETDEGKSIGYTYYRERGFSDSIIKTFQLGYCLDSWSDFTDKAIKEGFQPEVLIQAGLSKQGENQRYRDFYKGRVIIPIHNLTGKVIGFGGRILSKSENAPKYINTPETEVYQKSKVLFGMFQSRKGIRQENHAILVEGYTDVISLHQGGVENAVASSGTSLTEDQVKLIKKFTENIIILYDGDAAGIKAALRGLDIALEQGLNIKLVLLPDNEDPDSYIRKHGGQALKDFIKLHATDFILFKTKLLKNEVQNDPNQKSVLIQDIIGSIARIQDPIKRSVYIKECANLMDIQEQLIINEVQKKRKKKIADLHKSNSELTLIDNIDIPSEEFKEENIKLGSATYACEKDICKLLIESGKLKINEAESVADYIFANLEGIDLKDPSLQIVYNHIRDLHQRDIVMDPQYFYTNEMDVISKPAIELATPPDELANWNYKSMDVELPQWGENFIREMEASIARYRLIKVQELFAENIELLKQSETEANEDAISLRLQMSMELNKIKKELSIKIGKVV